MAEATNTEAVPLAAAVAGIAAAAAVEEEVAVAAIGLRRRNLRVVEVRSRGCVAIVSGVRLICFVTFPSSFLAYDILVSIAVFFSLHLLVSL